MAASRYAIGDARFVAQTEGWVEARRSGRTQDEDLDFPRWTVSPDEIDAAVQIFAQLNKKSLTVVIVPEDFRAAVAAAGNVVDGVAKIDAW